MRGPAGLAQGRCTRVTFSAGCWRGGTREALPARRQGRKRTPGSLFAPTSPGCGDFGAGWTPARRRVRCAAPRARAGCARGAATRGSRSPAPGRSSRTGVGEPGRRTRVEAQPPDCPRTGRAGTASPPPVRRRDPFEAVLPVPAIPRRDPRQRETARRPDPAHVPAGPPTLRERPAGQRRCGGRIAPRH